jgi:hypothetical protein
MQHFEETHAGTKNSTRRAGTISKLLLKRKLYSRYLYSYIDFLVDLQEIGLRTHPCSFHRLIV